MHGCEFSPGETVACRWTGKIGVIYAITACNDADTKTYCVIEHNGHEHHYLESDLVRPVSQVLAHRSRGRHAFGCV